MIKRTRKTYTAKQKNAAIALYLKSGKIKQGIALPTLTKWLKDHKKGIEMTTTKSGKKKKEIMCSVCKADIEKSGE